MEKSLDPAVPNQAALILAIRRSSQGASYAPYQEGVKPWHAAMAASYVHATAPLRRLADRYVVMAAHAVANGQNVPDAISQAFARLPKVMARADALAGNIERAVVDLAEAVVLQDRVGERFEAVVTDVDERGARIHLCGLPVISRIKNGSLAGGENIKVRLDAADPEHRLLAFSVVP
jgi:exoribonuclease R